MIAIQSRSGNRSAGILSATNSSCSHYSTYQLWIPYCIVRAHVSISTCKLANQAEGTLASSNPGTMLIPYNTYSNYSVVRLLSFLSCTQMLCNYFHSSKGIHRPTWRPAQSHKRQHAVGRSVSIKLNFYTSLCACQSCSLHSLSYSETTGTRGRERVFRWANGPMRLRQTGQDADPRPRCGAPPAPWGGRTDFQLLCDLRHFFTLHLWITRYKWVRVELFRIDLLSHIISSYQVSAPQSEHRSQVATPPSRGQMVPLRRSSCQYFRIIMSSQGSELTKAPFASLLFKYQ